MKRSQEWKSHRLEEESVAGKGAILYYILNEKSTADKIPSSAWSFTRGLHPKSTQWGVSHRDPGGVWGFGIKATWSHNSGAAEVSFASQLVTCRSSLNPLWHPTILQARVSTLFPRTLLKLFFCLSGEAWLPWVWHCHVEEATLHQSGWGWHPLPCSPASPPCTLDIEAVAPDRAWGLSSAFHKAHLCANKKPCCRIRHTFRYPLLFSSLRSVLNTLKTTFLSGMRASASECRASCAGRSMQSPSGFSDSC